MPRARERRREAGKVLLVVGGLYATLGAAVAGLALMVRGVR